MTRTNVVTADFTNTTLCLTESLYQYDYGQILKFEGIESLPDAYEVYFSNEQSKGEATKRIGTADGVVIPDVYLTTGKKIYAWMVLHTGENDGEVVYTVMIPVMQRSQPTDVEPTPVQQDVITQTIAALNVGVQKVEEAQDAWENMTAQAETLAPESEATASYSDGVLTLGIPEGKQGEQGNTGNGIASTILNPDYTLTINFTDGTSCTTASIRGAQGNDGDDGVGIASTMLNADYTLTITLTDGTSYTTPSIRGQKGEKGDKGNTPTITTQKSERTTTIYADGVAVGTVEDGENGRTPVITASKSGSVTTIYADSTAIATINDGQDGYTPIKGTDYWTAQDKTEIVDDVLESQELSDALDTKAPVIQNTASGTIASFTDGADNMPLKKCLVHIEPVQDLHGYDAPWPAGGGKNLFNESNAIVEYDSNRYCKLENGLLHYKNGGDLYCYSKEFDINLPSGSYTLSLSNYRLVSGVAPIWMIRIGSNPLTYPSTNTAYTFTLAEPNTVKIRLSTAGSTSATEFYGNVQLEKGSTVTSYEPYSNICPITGWDGVNVVSSPTTDEQDGETYSVTFPSEAGTVYGGTIDVVSGELIVNKRLVVLDGSIEWKESSISPSGAALGLKRYWVGLLISRLAKLNATTISSGMATVTEASWNVTRPGSLRTEITGRYEVAVYSSDYPNADAWRAHLSVEPMQAVYELATPLTYHLTPTEIRTLLGANNIWADTGDTEVTYCADTKEYVDGHGKVTDVQINGTSIVSDGVAEIGYASNNDAGVVKINSTNGIGIESGHTLCIEYAPSNLIKAGTGNYRPVTPPRQHESVFYGLAKAAGDTSQSSSSNSVGTYTDDAKIAIQKMLGIYQAPWELIREDTFTNDTEADHTISVDGNGETFELTEAFLQFESPVQETEAKWNNSGGVQFYIGIGTGGTIVKQECGSYTQTANSTAHGCTVVMRQEGNLLEMYRSANASNSNTGTIGYRYSVGFNMATGDRVGLAVVDAPVRLYKIVINKYTGTGHYKLYGKRKWQ